jgi:hypothetical protein
MASKSMKNQRSNEAKSINEMKKAAKGNISGSIEEERK